MVGIPDSELAYRPFDIGVSLLEAIDLDLTRGLGTGHHQSTPSWRRSGTPWYCLRSLLAFSCPRESEALKGSVFCPLLKRSHGEHMRDRPHWVLSSDRLLLGVVKSPRPEDLIADPSRMAKMLDPRLQAAGIALNSLFRCYIGV
jgi:hypothetical protein